MGGQLHAPAALPPEKRAIATPTGGMGRSQVRYGCGKENLCPLEFDPGTIEPVASCYTG